MKNCFVIMPIGSIQYNDLVISAEVLRKKYDDLIKEAITKAAPYLEVVRADDVARPGTISTDIITRIMHSDLVIADVTYPNPNVFYELGLRHACRTGTIIIKDKNGPMVPFDISHLRYIEYENTSSGLKELTAALQAFIENMRKEPDRPDNQLLEHAKLTGYKFISYSLDSEGAKLSAFKTLIRDQGIVDLMVRKASGEEVDAQLIRATLGNPEAAAALFAGALNKKAKSPKQIKKGTLRKR